MFNLFTRTIRTRDGQTYRSECKDFKDADTCIDLKSWFKTEHIHRETIEQDIEAVNFTAILTIILFSTLFILIVWLMLAYNTVKADPTPPPPKTTTHQIYPTPSPKNCSSMTYTTPLKQGDQGKQVQLIQQQLQNHYPLIADTNFGTQTEQAIRQFQSEQGLMVDGVVGNETWNKLFNKENC